MNVKKIGVIGGGTMGQRIAEMLAVKGLDVLLMEKSPEKLDEACQKIECNLDKQLKKWALTVAEKKLIVARISKITDFTLLQTCDMIIETITEDLGAKQALLAQLDQVCPSHIIVASNTSTFAITELAKAMKYGERVVGIHFVYPVCKVDAVEISRGVQTSEAVFEATRHFVAEVLQKKSIMVAESPGLVTARMMGVFVNEALHILQSGIASAAHIDYVMRTDNHLPYGPLEMADRFGLDAILTTLERMFDEFGELKYRPAELLVKMVAAGKLGMKSGQGFFTYSKDGDRL